MRVRRLNASEASAAVPALAEILIECVEGGASVSFMPPMAVEKSTQFWTMVADGVARGERALLVAEDDGGTVIGTVQLILALPENQSHRADVAKMLVRRSARRRGVAQRLMEAVDEVARDEGRTVLVLDAVTDGDAARLYSRTGWQRVGDVPNFALMPDGSFCSTTYFYKHLEFLGQAHQATTHAHDSDEAKRE